MKFVSTSAIYLVVLALLTGCGPTRAEVIQQYQPAFAKLRAQLTTIAENLPPIGDVTYDDTCPPLDPPLIVKELAGARDYTGALLTYDQLLDPDLKLSSAYPAVSTGGMFLATLRWTGPKNPLGKSAQKEIDPGFAEELEEGLATPYLIVHRIVAYQPARLVSDRSFVPGQVALDGFVFSLKDNQLLCSYRLDVTLSKESVSYRKVGDQLAQAMAPGNALQRALEKEARLAIQQTLTKMTGGTITYDAAYLP